jgi:hypothetical protein
MNQTTAFTTPIVRFLTINHLYICWYHEGIWIRTNKYGPNGPGWDLRFPSRSRYFSERNGYEQVYKLPFGFRLVRLEPDLGRIK